MESVAAEQPGDSHSGSSPERPHGENLESLFPEDAALSAPAQ